MSTPASRRRFVQTIVASAAAVGARASAQQTGGIRGFDHVALPMQNTDAMLAFYRGLGLRRHRDCEGVSVYVGDQMINFHRPVAVAERVVHAARAGGQAAVRRSLLRVGGNARRL